MKRIIFDVDNTLIPWKDEYRNAIKKTIEKYKLNVDYLKVDAVIETYEEYYDYYSKENMLELINNHFKLNLNIDFVEYWLKQLGKMAEKDHKVIETIEYLSKKYELVILTNWFKENQIERLKEAGIYKYFKEIYAGEEVLKPNKQSYLNAIENYKPEECFMIGDSYEMDIKEANKLGLKTILIDSKNKYPESAEYTKITKIIDLKEIL